MTTSFFPAEKNLHSVALEQAVLSSLMSIHDSVDSLPTEFAAAAFFVEQHQMIYTAITKLVAASKPYDAVMVMGYLTDHEQLDFVGGESFLVKLLADSPSSLFNLPSYAQKLLELLARRRALAALQQAQAALLTSPDQNVADVIGGAITGCLESFATDGSKKSMEGVDALMKSFALRTLNPVERRGYDTGFYPLTQMTSGFVAGQLIVIGARPALGKTTLALNMLDAIMLSSGKQGLFFSLEMDADQLTDRYIASLSSVPLSCIKTGSMSEEQRRRVIEVARSVTQTRKLVIDAPDSLSPQSLLMSCRKAQRQGEIGAIVVDYLQLMRSPAHAQNRLQEISEISRSLKALARQMNCPVIALSQLNRELEKTGRRPRSADLRESGQIEQDCDMILMLHREPPAEGKPPSDITELILTKHRNGETGTIPILFQGQFSRYVDATPEAFEGYV